MISHPSNHLQEDEEESPGELKEVVRTFSCPCGRWLARDEEDGEILVELRAEDYEDLEGIERDSILHNQKVDIKNNEPFISN